MSENKNSSQTHLRNIEDIMSESFGRYAKYIIQDRALPDARDGLKPVQRRIIYAMNDLGIVHDKPHKKSARSVGEVIGKYHPHGDSSIYEAMVRMSQDWKNNIPLIDMHGNNGSLDDDPPAAMRYTEARLSYFSECMISDIKKDTVDFIENFDGSEVEPTVLPSLLPNLLVNGVSGIAAGYATNIPCFNLSEVIDAIITRIDSPNCRVETIKNVMPCPDFPTGGIILNLEGVDEAYNTGKGKIIIRGKFEQKDKKTLYITEIPYETTKTKIIDQINDLAEKYDSLNISEAYDESDKNGVSICIVLKSGANIDFVKNFLYKNTELQISYNINMIAIKDRKPYLMNILFLLDAFIEHINNIITKATTYDYNKALARKEILVGLIKAVKIVDDIVFIIRHSNDKNTAKLSLISKLGFSENQAEAIVNLRLYRLSNSDVSEMEKELIELDKQIAEHELILNNKDYKNNFIKRKMREYKKIFPSPRKTVYSSEDHIVSIDQTDIVEDKQTLIVVTHDGYLKNISKKSFGMCEYDELKIKEGDIPIAQFESNFKNKLILVTSFGNYISIPVFKIEQTKWKDIGIHINSIISIDSEEKIIAAFDYDNNVNDDRILIIASKQRMIKRTLVKDLGISKLTKITKVMKLSNDDKVVSCLITSDQNANVGVVSELGKIIIYPSDQISIIGKDGSGVKNTNLEDENIASIFLNNTSKDYLLIVSKQGMKRIKKETLPLGNRTNSPKSFVSQVKNNPIIIKNAFEINQNDMINCLEENGKWEIIKASEVSIGDPTTRVSPISGKKIIFANFLNPLKSDEVIEEKSDESLFDK